jgi:hypothetical protein
MIYFVELKSFAQPDLLRTYYLKATVQLMLPKIGSKPKDVQRECKHCKSI